MCLMMGIACREMCMVVGMMKGEIEFERGY